MSFWVMLDDSLGADELLAGAGAAAIAALVAELASHQAATTLITDGVLINQFNVAPEDAARFIEAWTDDAAFMKQQPGFISTQLHQGTAGSATFVNVAVWESARALGRAFSSPEFQARVARYPDSTVAAPHVFKKVAIPGICVA